ncbi:5-(carboxyamino)imidazole ribonucleotide synthase [Hyphomicrobium sp. CS1GBMeth3]|uniref:5-(carboxyamino)imidazole ribonucleotide synthase n=1 Tax=Hyphomicrobium sp. CS1GBMeth3 TaxID=1892845 RepID=UPI0009316AC1|nr:5-(carboxyamino)imidazole ribonucleotide synthase [Hyphomicrobium sp. CS1GBMeth3]
MTALPPGSTIGILGGGQLGRMLTLAAAELGLKCHIYSDVPGGACDVACASTIGPFEDAEKVRAFAETVDVVTYEFENVPLRAAAAAEAVAPVRPGPKALAVAQDRLEEKNFIEDLGLPVAPFANVEDDASLAAALSTIGETGILKTRRLGYDGKGQVRIKSAADLAPAFESLKSAPCVLEGLVPFDFEVSVLVVRALTGETRFYDIPLNTHKNGILDTSTVPSPLPEPHAARARDIAGAIAAALDYVGVLAVEMFYVPGAPEPLVVNEIAPRVHNSGHWTMDACLISQFENHIRAVVGWPLGDTARHADVTMTNLIGADVDRWRELAAEPGTALHLYGKPEPRPGRKMGHINRLRPGS